MYSPVHSEYAGIVVDCSGNRQKPTCSRCTENGRQCTYTTKKRKPGPSKGSTATRRRTSLSIGKNNQRTMASAATANNINHEDGLGFTDIQPPVLDPGSVSHDLISSDNNSPSANSWKGYRMIDVQSETSIESLAVAQWGLSQEAELDLLEVFFDSIQPLYPLFRRHDLLSQYNAGQIPSAVLASIFAVTAALSTNSEIMMRDSSTVGEHYAMLTRQACAPLCMSGVPATISDLRALFLLAVYEFRTSPNRRAWATAGHLVRLAYHYGLHQVDNLANCSLYEPDVTSPVELESWRYLWWSIYVLDTYCNSTASTPSDIDLDSLCTALPSGTVEDWTNGVNISTTGRVFLQGDIEDLSSLLKRASNEWLQNVTDRSSIDTNLVVRLVITSQMRSVFHLRRAVSQNPSGKFERKQQLILNQLAATRMALSAKYQCPKRKVSLGEQKQDHALRLVNLLELQISQVPVTLLRTLEKPNQDEVWLSTLDSSIGLVEDIVQIVRDWNPSMQKLTDPSVCYIVFIAMILCHTESKLELSRARTSRPDADSGGSWQLLHLFLEQLGNQWLLPKALIVAAEKFRDAASGPITLSDAFHISKSLQRPLSFQPRREMILHDHGIDYSMNVPFPTASLETSGLYDWLNAFDQGEITFP